jgi:hypothetical protein
LLRNEGVDPHVFAASARTLILENPQNYHAFGVYWFLVKALLKRIYPPAEMPLLGDYVDEAVVERMPKGLSLAELLAAASDEYAANVSLCTPSRSLEDPDGEVFTLFDPDVEGGAPS